jgi:hypothetical protein
VPPGGTTNQVLGKTSATDYATSWQTPAGGLTLPLTQNLTFSPDNAYDIGASGANRPRSIYAATSVVTSALSAYQLFSPTNVLDLGANNTARWEISSAGHLLAYANNVYDIGANDAFSKPRDLWLGRNLAVGGNETLTGTLTSSSVILSTGQSPAPTANAPAANAFWDGTLARFVGYNWGAGTWQPVQLQGSSVLLTAQTGSITLASTTAIGTNATPPTLRALAATLELDAPDSSFLTGANQASLGGNARFDGTNWNRYATGSTATLIQAGPAAAVIYTAPAGANPISWTSRMAVDAASGKVTLPAGTAQAQVGGYTGSPTFTLSTVNAWTETPIKVTITATGAPIRVEFSTGFWHSAANGKCQVGVGFDGVVQLGMMTGFAPVANMQMNFSLIWYTTPTPGSHTVSVFVINNATGTLTLDNGINSLMYVTEQRC